MDTKSFPITTENQSHIRAWIGRQFKTHSWWPAEAPHEAREAFAALDESPEALHVWCSQWLDGGQWRLLRIAVESAAKASELT